MLFLTATAQSYSQKPQVNKSDSLIVYKLNIKEEIGPAIWRQTKQSFTEAKQHKADIILIHMNTYGGLVDAADSIRTAILNSKIPVWVFIDNNAASAGALISIACDSIYMRPGANIGAASVV
ncbi:MAG TPA: serine protease, partial [Bacteroidales bacterium]|nr:serine protease [Bacteroidales bacterium]